MHATLDRIVCEAIASHTTFRADLYTSPTVMDPSLIQFTIGHPSCATLLWHVDGEVLVAHDDHRHSHPNAAVDQHHPICG